MELQLTDIFRHHQVNASILRKALQETAAASAQQTATTTAELRRIAGITPADVEPLQRYVGIYRAAATRLARIHGEGFSSLPPHEIVSVARIERGAIESCERVAAKAT